MKINPQYEQLLMIMNQSGGLTKNEIISLVNQKDFFDYCNERYDDRPRYYKGGKYKMAVTNLDHEYQAKKLGGIMNGFAKSVQKQVIHVLNTTTDPFIRELGDFLGLIPKKSPRKIRAVQ